MPSPLLCASSRAASYLKISVINRASSSSFVVKDLKNETHDVESTIGKGKIEQEQLGEEMKNLFDEMKNSSDKVVTIPKKVAHSIMPFRLQSDDREMVCRIQYLCD